MTDFRRSGFQVLPPVVKNLLIINVLLFLAKYVAQGMGIDLDDYLGLHYWRSELFQPWQLVTHIFMHGSFSHILFNMFSLWMFGSAIENYWGPKKFLIFYMICGLGAALCHLTVLGFQYEAINDAFNAYQQNPTLDQFLLFIQKHISPYESRAIAELKTLWAQDPSSLEYSNFSKTAIYHSLYGVNVEGVHKAGIFDQATVGASGAIYGLLFAFGYMFPNEMLYFSFFIPVKAKWAITGLIVIELVSGIQNSAGDNVAHFAHLGGMLFAFILLKIWNKRNRRYYN